MRTATMPRKGRARFLRDDDEAESDTSTVVSISTAERSSCSTSELSTNASWCSPLPSNSPKPVPAWIKRMAAAVDATGPLLADHAQERATYTELPPQAKGLFSHAVSEGSESLQTEKSAETDALLMRIETLSSTIAYLEQRVSDLSSLPHFRPTTTTFFDVVKMRNVRCILARHQEDTLDSLEIKGCCTSGMCTLTLDLGQKHVSLVEEGCTRRDPFRFEFLASDVYACELNTHEEGQTHIDLNVRITSHGAYNVTVKPSTAARTTELFMALSQFLKGSISVHCPPSLDDGRFCAFNEPSVSSTLPIPSTAHSAGSKKEGKHHDRVATSLPQNKVGSTDDNTAQTPLFLTLARTRSSEPASVPRREESRKLSFDDSRTFHDAPPPTMDGLNGELLGQRCVYVHRTADRISMRRTPPFSAIGTHCRAAHVSARGVAQSAGSREVPQLDTSPSPAQKRLFSMSECGRRGGKWQRCTASMPLRAVITTPVPLRDDSAVIM